MPTAEQIKQFFAATVVPPLAGAAAAWLFIHVHFLAIFHIAQASAAGEITQLGVWGVTTVIGFLVSHNILKGHYTPAAKANTNV